MSRRALLLWFLWWLALWLVLLPWRYLIGHLGEVYR